MVKIEEDEYEFAYDDGDDDDDTLAFARTLKVDVNNRFFALIGKHKLMVFNIEKPEVDPKKIYQYDLKNLKHLRLEMIYDVYIESSS